MNELYIKKLSKTNKIYWTKFRRVAKKRGLYKRMESKYFISMSDEDIEREIEELPEHLRKIFELRVDADYDRRHALFIAKSYSWRKPDVKS